MDRLLNGPKWIPAVMFGIVAVVLVGLFLLTVINGRSEPDTQPTTTSPTVTGPVLPTARPSATPTPTGDAPEIIPPGKDEPLASFPLTEKELQRAAAVAVEFQNAASTYTWETTDLEYWTRLDLLAYNGDAAVVLGGGTPGPLVPDPAKAREEKLAIEGKSVVLETLTVSSSGATFIMGTTTEDTRNGKTTSSGVLVQQVSVEKEDGSWKVLTVSLPTENYVTTE